MTTELVSVAGVASADSGQRRDDPPHESSAVAGATSRVSAVASEPSSRSSSQSISIPTPTRPLDKSAEERTHADASPHWRHPPTRPNARQLASSPSSDRGQQDQTSWQQARVRPAPASHQPTSPSQTSDQSAGGRARRRFSISSGTFRLHRLSSMACLTEIPKYAFGTSHTIDSRGGGDQGDATTSGAGIPSNAAIFGAAVSRVTPSGPPSARIDANPRISPDDFKKLVLHAIHAGCRHFDCAPLYGTQPLVGECIASAGPEVPRQNFFLTSKLPPNMMRLENIDRSICNTIQELQCSYLDLFLIHAPFATQYRSDDDFYPTDKRGELLLDESANLLENAWRRLGELKRRGLTRYIGLSNVSAEQLVRLNAIHQVDVVQNEYHIYNQNRDLFDHCEEIDVHFEGYACFGNPAKCKRDLLPSCFDDPMVNQVARKHSLSLAQTIIQWIHHQPLSYVIKCDNVRQFDENFQATSLRPLPVEDLIELDSLDKRVRVHHFTEHRGIVKHREYPYKRVAGRELNNLPHTNYTNTYHYYQTEHGLVAQQTAPIIRPGPVLASFSNLYDQLQPHHQPSQQQQQQPQQHPTRHIFSNQHNTTDAKLPLSKPFRVPEAAAPVVAAASHDPNHQAATYGHNQPAPAARTANDPAHLPRDDPKLLAYRNNCPVAMDEDERSDDAMAAGSPSSSSASSGSLDLMEAGLSGGSSVVTVASRSGTPSEDAIRVAASGANDAAPEPASSAPTSSSSTGLAATTTSPAKSSATTSAEQEAPESD